MNAEPSAGASLLHDSADRAGRPRLSVVVPTFQEVLNIPVLIERLERLRSEAGLDLDVLIMDDDSQDGSAELVAKMALPWVRLITRTADRGLSPAVLDGLSRADGDVLVVMDADLSHPPEAIPQMLSELEAGADFVVGSRFVPGGTTDDDWGVHRWLNSRFATILAMPLSRLKDPMSGFFMLRRATFLAGKNFNPIGYKIGLELLIKCDCRRPVEVPIHFTDRRLGKSKLSLKEQLRYLQHIRRLYIYRYALFSQVIQFLVVGGSGLFVNLVALTIALHQGLPTKTSVAIAIVLSLVWNFILNRRFAFSYAKHGPIVKQFLGFASACSVGAVVNYFVTIWTLPWLSSPQLAAIVGVAAGTIFNFIASRYLVFKVVHIAPGRESSDAVPEGRDGSEGTKSAGNSLAEPSQSSSNRA